MRSGRSQPALIRPVRQSMVALCFLTCCGLAPASDEKAKTVRAVPGIDAEIVYRGSDDANINAIAVSPDGRLLAMLADQRSEHGGFRTSFRVWDMTTRRVRLSGSFPDEHLARYHEREWDWIDSFWQIAFSPDGKFLAAASVECDTVKVWEVATGKERLNFSVHDAPQRQYFRRFWFSDDSRTLTLDVPREWWIGGPDEWIEELTSVDTASWGVQSRRRIPSEEVYTTALKPDGTSIVVASRDGETITRWAPGPWWDPAAPQARITDKHLLDPPVPDGHRDGPSWLAISPDCSTVAFSGKLIQWVDGKPKTVVLEGGDSPGGDSLTFSPDGRLICGIRSYHVETLAARLTGAVLGWPEHFVRLPLEQGVSEVNVWETATGRRLFIRKRADWYPGVVAFFAGNHRLAIAESNQVLVCHLPDK
jgi:WD40 repeat protein